MDKGRIKKSDSWDETAAWVGTAPDVLKATVEQYDSFYDMGYDADFLKDKSIYCRYANLLTMLFWGVGVLIHKWAI